MVNFWTHSATQTEGNGRSKRWSCDYSRSCQAGDEQFKYTIGWDRLPGYEDLLLRRFRSGRMLSATPYAENGPWTAELDILERRGNVSLVVSQFCPSDYIIKDKTGSFSVKKYRPNPNVHLHIKADFFEDDHNSVFRVTTAHMSTQRIGPIAVGMRGLGRTELFFQTNHAGLIAEAGSFMRCLHEDRVPISGLYLRAETPLENGIYPALCTDIRKLSPGTGRILHFRSFYHGAIWKPGKQDLNGLLELHSLLEEYARAGTETLVAYGELNSPILERLKRFAQSGADTGIPGYFPGSFAPYRLLSLIHRIPFLQPFKLAEHMNVTVIDGIRDTPSSAPYAVIYTGSKSDSPYDPEMMDLMVRCDTREFPGIETGLVDLISTRIKRQPEEILLRTE